jgi:hypothetical protein
MTTTKTVNDLSEPAGNLVAVTPNDSTDIAETRALWIGGAGNVTVDMAGGGTNVTVTGALAGTFLPLRVTRVYDTDTTATNILAVY